MSDTSGTSDSDTDDRTYCDHVSHQQPRHRSGGSILNHVIFAAVIRFLLLFYGVVHDKMFTLKYTDVDYIVFTDAARFVKQGRSPFLRDGYRYTPLIAFLLLPDVYIPFLCLGKMLFLMFDILTGCMIYRILKRLTTTVEPDVALICTLIWLYNPLPLVVSTRGSSDSIQTFLVLAVFYCLIKDRIAAAGLLFGLAVHIKIYPVIYIPVIYLLLAKELPTGVLMSVRLWNPFTWKRISFFASALIAFTSTTGFCWYLYGERYLNESWIYHFHRKDVQHNFSVYFYIYRLVPDHYHQMVSSLAFLPQLFTIIIISVRYLTAFTASTEELFSRFLSASFHITFLFVSLNKVITSQYFLWYLCLLPFVLPHVPDVWTRDESEEQTGLSFSTARSSWFSRQFMFLTIQWLAGQAIWLLPAYLYEFKRWHKSLLFVWIASLAFLAINLRISLKLSPRFPQLKEKKHL
jgi:phosphatidylinositol glycan class M